VFPQVGDQLRQQLLLFNEGQLGRALHRVNVVVHLRLTRRGASGAAIGPFSDGAAAGGGSCLEEGVVSKGGSVVILGIILIIVGLLVASLKVLLWVGIVLLVVGLILNFVPIGGRRRRIF